MSVRPDQQTLERQGKAADPLLSAWVSANAGSGKTWVLSTRVIRLLLAGVEPSKILCLTYTKTAAAEMKNRVFVRLGDWVNLENTALAKELSNVTGRHVDEAQIAFARTLFAQALETPGGLKIQTIHAFCEALLHRFPLEANIAGHFELIDETASAYLVAEARRQLLTGHNPDTRAALARVLSQSGETGLEKLLGEIVGKRQKLDRLLEALGSANERRLAYFKHFEFEEANPAEHLKTSVWDGFPLELEYLRSVRDEAAAMGKTRTYEFAYGCVVALEHRNQTEGYEMLVGSVLKKSGEPYGSGWLFAKDVQNKFPDLAERYEQAAAQTAHIVSRLNLLAEIEKTLDALTIADRLLELYNQMKSRRGLLDFDDLIVRTEAMLMRPDVAAWVRMKLDQGIDHILVDEAQDTSPTQWSVIRTLADEFFDGESASSANRTVFAVGDEKQSIYSFQGADPRGFDDARLHFQVKVRNAENAFADLRLDSSFRSTKEVLAAVDHVFAFVDHKRGVASADGSFPPHHSLREAQPGSVELWDVKEPDESEDEEDWRKPVDHAQKPTVVVAERIAKHIKNWLDDGAVNSATGELIKPGDILVLVRKRDAFVNALTRALKVRDVPVAGADRLSMVGHIAVLDMMALGRVMLNRDDDLSLAALLRSPLFGWSDEQLFEFAYGRGNSSLWMQLSRAVALTPHARIAFSTLEQWRTIAVNKPVFEFYSYVLGVGEARRKLIGRLGPETGDMLDEFLNFAIAQERTGAISLETFLNTLESFSPEIKREMNEAADEVRIMTVHGAKGLEAPFVFLIDPGSPAYSGQTAPMLLPLEMQSDLQRLPSVLWGNASAERSHQSSEIHDELRAAAEEEYRRLLYVGMTRAADHLIVAGYTGKTGQKDGTWHAMVQKGLEEYSTRVEYVDFGALKFPAQQMAPDVMAKTPDVSPNEQGAVLPQCFETPAPAEPPASRPLMPSGAYGLSVEADSQDSDGELPASLLESIASSQATDMNPQLAMRRGTAIHKLLQMLPDIALDERASKARAYCEYFEPRWTKEQTDAICQQVFAVLDHPEFAPFFASGAQAEVSVMGTLKIGDEERAVSGVIDRLSVVEDCVYLVDYKTNAHPPQKIEDVPQIYLRQMALYHALVAPLYPGKTVKAALLFSTVPNIIELDEATLTAALDGLAPMAQA